MQDQNNMLSFVQSPFSGASTGDMPVPQQVQTGDIPLKVRGDEPIPEPPKAGAWNSFPTEDISKQSQQDQMSQMPAVTQMASFLPGTANLNQGGNMFDVSFDPVTHNPFNQNSSTNKTGLYA